MDARKILGPGLLLGIGLGGFIDGIVLHQILGWHHMISARSDDLRLNTIADGFFHAAAFAAVVAGLFWLWRRVTGGTGGTRRPPTAALIGALIAGWGLFNVVEGIIDHHILRVHHVREGANATAYDVGFLVLSGLLLAGGLLLHRRADRAARGGPH